MNLKYKCLILDHDDTVVNSTRNIHYPVFRDVLAELRPDMHVSAEDFLNFSFEPGFEEYCINTYKFTKKELDYQYLNWKTKTREQIPEFFPGIIEFLVNYKNSGGIITVASHNDPDLIKRNYLEKSGIEPEMIFGWHEDKDKRKPAVFPVMSILQKFSLEKKEVLVVDDLKPGLLMAQNSGVDFAFPAWANHPDAIVSFMRINAKYFLNTVSDLEKIVFK